MIDHPYKPLPPDALAHSAVDHIERIVEQFPQNIALRARGDSLTYQAMNADANRFAHSLIQEFGDAPEPVALLLSRSIWIGVAIVGALKAGKYYVLLDPAHPVGRLGAILDELGAKVIAADAQTLDLARELANQKGISCVMPVDTLDQALPSHNPGVSITPESPFSLNFTSGTSGKPKGVMRHHSTIVASVIADVDDYHFEAGDRFTLLTSYSFAASRKVFFGAWLTGATVCAFDVIEGGFDDLARWLADEQITVFFGTPSLFRQFALTLKGKVSLPHLRLIIVNGETLHRHDVLLYQRHFSDGCQMVNSIGSTEIGAFCFYVIDRDTVIDSTIVPIGYPNKGITLRLLDEHGADVPAGELGEIAVKGKHITPGYWGNAATNDAKFRLQPDGEYMYLTGDLGRFRPDGALEHVGRADGQLKIRGQRVEPAEVETALLSHAGVRAAVVISRNRPVASEADTPEPALVAYLVADPMPSLPTLRRYLARHLPDYMIPAAFVQIDAIPLNVIGKIDTAKLPPPEFDALTGTPPSTPTERTLVTLMQPLLPGITLFRENSFFELGGDSLKALRLVASINQHFNTQLTPAVLFHEPTLAQLAAHIERGAPSSSPLVALNPFGSQTPLVCVHTQNGNPMSFSQLANELGADYPVYAFQYPRYDLRVPKYDSMEALARHYVSLTREMLHEDPVFLVGFSVGGIIAYEMAQQIAAAGGQPPTIIMVDSHFNIPGQPYGGDDYSVQQRRNARLEDSLLLTIRKLFHRARHALAKRLRNDPQDQILKRNKLEIRRLTKPYIAQSYVGKIIYLTCREDRQQQGISDKNDHLRWQALALGGFEIIDTPGPHHQALDAPYVEHAAEHFRHILAR